MLFYASVLLSASARASYWPSATLKEQEDFTFLEGFMVEDVWLEYLKYTAVGKTDVLSTYDQEKLAGYIYVFDELVLHNIVVFGTKRNFDVVISSIKER